MTFCATIQHNLKLELEGKIDNKIYYYLMK